MKKKKIAYLGQGLFIVLSVFLMGYLLDYAQLSSVSYSAQMVFKDNLPVYLITVIVLLIVYLGLYGLTNRFFISTTIFYVFFGIYGIADHLKVQYRSEPILPSDLMFLGNIKELLSMVKLSLIIWVIAIILVLAALCFVLEKQYGKNLIRFRPIPRVLLVLLTILSLGSFYTSNREGTFNHFVLNKAGYSDFAANINWSANSNGPLLTFLTNMHIDVMGKPADYNKVTMQRIVTKYRNEANKINQNRPNNNLQKQTLIFVLSESFSDPSRVPNIKMNQEVMPNIKQVKKNNTSGLMMSSGYGGGTANIEYMTLTGLAYNQFSKSLSSPFTQLVIKQKQPLNIANSFKTTAAIHPYYGNFYDRSTVYQKFVIQTFRNINTSGNLGLHYTATADGGQYISDDSAYKEALWQVNKEKGGQFINLVTMQNHMPYTTNYAGNQFKASGKGAGKNLQQVANFAKGLNMTDETTKNFLDQIDKLKKPITIVWYGDHLPGIYDGNKMSQYNVQQHATDYFVYSNRYALKHNYGTKKLSNATEVTDPNGFIPLALRQMKQQVTPYYALLTKVQEDVPAMARNSVGGNENLYVNNKEKQVTPNNLTKKQKQIIHDYRLVQYDLTAGKGYSRNVINK
ncbi:LTA synthase family protein [Companilactobacillus sp. HBUAS56275]|uniref:LTA synthase family protein n=1 Tax=Companilactobacillus sp. HBUAS56275 TaxID=3109364 RepID=UPI002FF2A970